MSSSEDSTSPIENEPVAISAPKISGGAKGVSLLVGGALVLGAAVVGTVVYGKLASSNDYPYMHMADGAFSYTQVNLDPSVDQKLSINKLAKKFPELKGEDGVYKALTSDNIAGSLLKDGVGGDFSWVGDRLAASTYPDADDDGIPEISILIEAKDEPVKGDLDKLRKGLGTANLRKVDVPGGDFVGYSTMVSEKAFPESNTLGNAKKFTAEFKEIQGNVAGSWVNLAEVPKGLTGAGLATGFAPQDGPGLKGSLLVSVEAFDDGLDARFTLLGQQENSTLATLSQVDSGKVGEVLSANSYEKPLGGLAVGSLAQTILVLLDQNEAGFGPEARAEIDKSLAPLGLTHNDLPGLLGEVTSLSVAAPASDIVFTLHGEGIDPEIWDELKNSGKLDALVASRGEGAKFNVERSGNNVNLTMGNAPLKGYDAPSGKVAGYLELDEIGKLLDSKDTIGEGLGKIIFVQESDDAGRGDSVISWRTTR